ncbi:MAG: hypothetical protein IJ602_06315 [Paludibacteraceae bacterium]|nr:hypothetical protein [Paludibacteraceae bacterium]
MVGLASQLRDILQKAKKGIPAERGIMEGENYVRIGNMTYPAAVAVDLNLMGGDPVWCQVTDGGAQAVIVGQ